MRILGDEADHVFSIVAMSAVHSPGMGRARGLRRFPKRKSALDQALAPIARGRRGTCSVTIFLRKCDAAASQLIVRSTS